jgi:Cu(I)/Ag(I) efflux system periplasmic protein CusF
MKSKSIFVAAMLVVIPLSLTGVAGATYHETKNVPADVAALTDGEVKKVDKSAAKVTIKHGPLKNLDMPAMTMVFRVKEASILDQLAVGDKIKFSAEKIDGAYTVTNVKREN